LEGTSGLLEEIGVIVRTSGFRDEAGGDRDRDKANDPDAFAISKFEWFHENPPKVYRLSNSKWFSERRPSMERRERSTNFGTEINAGRRRCRVFRR
jgi:hypothetical protein